MTTAIDITQLNMAFKEQEVLKDIDLLVEKGEFIGLVGPNGGGKTTLLKLILGLLQPDSGSIRVLGQSAKKAAQHIGYVPQYPLFPRDFPITVEQVVLLGCTHPLFGGYTTQDQQIAQDVMQETEISTLARRSIDSLSGGELQRVLVARALVTNPEIILLDEPTANIDMRVESEIFDLLNQLNERMTVVVVSHDVGFISSYVRRVACLNHTLVCHHTEEISGKDINELYGGSVKHILHHHHEHRNTERAF